MVTRKITNQVALAAIAAQLAVARKQHWIGEAGRMQVRPGAGTLDGKNGFGGQTRTFAVLLPSAAKLADLTPDRPRNHLLRVIGDGLFQGYPRLGQPGHVNGQDQRFHD